MISYSHEGPSKKRKQREMKSFFKNENLKSRGFFDLSEILGPDLKDLTLDLDLRKKMKKKGFFYSDHHRRR